MTPSTGPIQLLYQRLYVVVVVTIAAALAAWFFSERVTPIYRSQARIFLPMRGDAFSLTSEEANMPTGPRLPTGSAELLDSLMGLLEAADLRQLVAAQIEGRTSADLEKSVSFAVDKFNRVTISVFDPDPEMARRIAETYVREFRVRLDETTKAAMRSNADLLVQAIEDTERQIHELEQERLRFLQGKGTVDYSTEFAMKSEEVALYRRQVATLDAKVASAQQGIAELERQLAERPDATPENFVPRSRSEVRNPRLDQLASEIRAAEVELAELKTKYRPKHPDVVAKEEQLKLLRDELASESERIAGTEEFGPDPMREDLEKQLVTQRIALEAANGERARYQELLERAQAELMALPEVASKLEDFDSRLKKLRETLSLSRSRLNEFQLYLKRDTSYLGIAEAPVAPQTPYLPRTDLAVLAGALLGLVLSVTLAVGMVRAAVFRQEALWS